MILSLFLVHGGVTPWQGWSKCSVECGPGGFQVRRRYCSNPPPANGGNNCTEELTEERDCLEDPRYDTPGPRLTLILGARRMAQ